MDSEIEFSNGTWAKEFGGGKKACKGDQIKSNQQTAIQLESLKYTSWWYYHPAYDNHMNKNDPKAVEDRLRKLKTDDLEKEIIIANATVKGKIWNALGSKQALQDERTPRHAYKIREISAKACACVC